MPVSLDYTYDDNIKYYHHKYINHYHPELKLVFLIKTQLEKDVINNYHRQEKYTEPSVHTLINNFSQQHHGYPQYQENSTENYGTVKDRNVI
jgi:hypothetical protein